MVTGVGSAGIIVVGKGMPLKSMQNPVANARCAEKTERTSSGHTALGTRASANWPVQIKTMNGVRIVKRPMMAHYLISMKIICRVYEDNGKEIVWNSSQPASTSCFPLSLSQSHRRRDIFH
jgi:hypothetical protein